MENANFEYNCPRNRDTTDANNTNKLNTPSDDTSILSESTCASTDDDSTTPEINDSHTHDALDDPPKTLQTLQTLAARVACKKIYNDTNHITDEFLDECRKAKEKHGLSGDEIMQMVMDQELDGNHLLLMTRELRYFKGKGLFTNMVKYEFQNIIKKSCARPMSMEDHHDSLQMLKDYTDLEKNAIRIVRNVDNMKTAVRLKYLAEDEKISKKMKNIFEKIDRGKVDIERTIAKLNPINIPGIVESLTILEEVGFLSEILICKTTSIAREIIQFSTFIADHVRIGDATVSGLNGVYMCDKKKGSYKKNKGEKHIKKPDANSKVKMCRAEHNLPFCENCGWMTSWVKLFKKRGIYVKEITGRKAKFNWVNNRNGT